MTDPQRKITVEQKRKFLERLKQGPISFGPNIVDLMQEIYPEASGVNIDGRFFPFDDKGQKPEGAV